MRRPTAALILAALLFILAACGDSGERPAATLAPTLTPSPTAAPAVPTSTPPPESSSTPAPTAGIPLEGHALGPEDAVVTIVMYGDFQCEICARYARDLEVLRAHYPADLRLIWRHLPDPRSHDKSALALQASEAAAAQGAFWEMHDQLYTHLADWIALPPDQFRPLLSQYAATVGLDVARFDRELDAGTYAPRVEAAIQDASDLGIMGVPALLVNGIPFSGRDDLTGFDEAVRLALLQKRFFAAAPPMTIDPSKNYLATIVTEKGSIVLDLFPRDAPIAVNNFVFLARSGWYDDITFHYVLPGYLAQTGDPSNTGRGGPGYTIPGEEDNGLIFDREGLVAMAHPAGMPDGAGSEFFITLGPLRPAYEWDGQYTIFGIVTQGMDVVRSLTPRNANDPIRFPDPPPGDRVITITIEES